MHHMHHKLALLMLGGIISCFAGCRSTFSFVEGFELESRLIDDGITVSVRSGSQQILTGTTIDFMAQCHVPNHSSITWDMGDSSIQRIGNVVSHTYEWAGTYTIKVTCKNERNHYAEDSVQVRVDFDDHSYSRGTRRNPQSGHTLPPKIYRPYH